MNSPRPEDAYRHQDVRNLAWALLSPQLCLLTPPCQPAIWQDPSLPNWLAALDREPGRLTRYLNDSGNSGDRRLGAYFEQLIGFFLVQNRAVTDLLGNLRIADEQRTLGELDLLYRPATGTGYTHLELCVKFYLCLEDPADPDQWLGLNPKDRLGNKIRRMSDHQLRLSSQPQARQILQQRGIQVGERQSLFCGRLFYPWQAYIDGRFSYPARVNSEHLRGWWLTEDNLAAALAGGYRLLPLDKRRWLASLPGQVEDPAATAFTPMLDRGPLMVARLAKGSDGWQELDRGVVLPRSWPW